MRFTLRAIVAFLATLAALVFLCRRWSLKTVSRSTLRLASSMHVTDSQVQTVIHHHFPGREVVSSLRLAGGVINAVFRVAVTELPRAHVGDALSVPSAAGQPEVVVKFSNPSWQGDCKLRNELGAMRLVRRHTTVPMPRVLAASDEPRSNGVGLAYIVFSVAEGEPLKGALAELTAAQQNTVFSQWADASRQLRSIRLPGYGSLDTRVGTLTARHDDSEESSDAPVTLAPLAGNALCTGLGPFDRYGQYAGARVEQFLPLLPLASAHMGPRLRCWSQATAAGGRRYGGDEKLLSPVLIHHDVSIRNLLIVRGEGRIGVRLSSVLDWEFALAAPFDDEAAFEFMVEGLDGDVLERFWQAWRGAGLPMPDPRVKENSLVYQHTVTMAHLHLWGLPPKITAKLLDDAHNNIDTLLRHRNC
eukprot:m.44177 g.44177  ORF g.44177 m.44177 type:complete len:417 (+) comp11684_c0_seq1:224-1474(+)